MEYNLKEVLKNLFINLVVTFVVAFVFDYFNIISKIDFIHIFDNKTANAIVILGLVITIIELIYDVFFDDDDDE